MRVVRDLFVHTNAHSVLWMGMLCGLVVLDVIKIKSVLFGWSELVDGIYLYRKGKEKDGAVLESR